MRRIGLTHAAPSHPVLLTELLTPEGVVVPLGARDKRGVIAELVQHLVSRFGGNFQDILTAIEEREAVVSTGIGFGVAIPHARTSAVHELSLVCGVSAEPVPFDSIDGEPVRLFFLIVGPESSAGQHIKVLSRIARLVRRENVRERLADARTPSQFYETLLEVESL